jgi:hypothetical protein
MYLRRLNAFPSHAEYQVHKRVHKIVIFSDPNPNS